MVLKCDLVHPCFVTSSCGGSFSFFLNFTCLQFFNTFLYVNWFVSLERLVTWIPIFYLPGKTFFFFARPVRRQGIVSRAVKAKAVHVRRWQYLVRCQSVYESFSNLVVLGVVLHKLQHLPLAVVTWVDQHEPQLMYDNMAPQRYLKHT